VAGKMENRQQPTKENDSSQQPTKPALNKESALMLFLG